MAKCVSFLSSQLFSISAVLQYLVRTRDGLLRGRKRKPKILYCCSSMVRVPRMIIVPAFRDYNYYHDPPTSVCIVVAVVRRRRRVVGRERFSFALIKSVPTCGFPDMGERGKGIWRRRRCFIFPPDSICAACLLQRKGFFAQEGDSPRRNTTLLKDSFTVSNRGNLGRKPRDKKGFPEWWRWYEQEAKKDERDPYYGLR